MKPAFEAGTLCGCLLFGLLAQQASAGQPPAAPPTPRTARAAAPIDLTGQWVSIINEDWRWRMVTPLKGDFSNIPLNAAARAVGQQWDPARDEAAGEQCKGYGAPAIMREPGRLRILWQDENTLKIETDSGKQTRILHFGAPVPAGMALSLQGYSVAKWEDPPGGRPSFGLGLGTRGGGKSNTLSVVTSRIQPGYLRKNGIPFSADVRMSEYFDMFEEPDGTEWFVITSVVEDPVYLNAPWLTSLNFKRERDRSKWYPTACSAR